MSEKVWDEYDWERFLQEQDRKTERYMELLEKYLDHPERDQLIAKEMGWTHLAEDDAQDWSDEADAFLDAEILSENEEEENPSQAAFDSFEKHPLYQASFALTIALDQMFDELPALQNHPAAVRLATHSAIGSAKLAAALSDDDIDEMGMTIAYLKRALKAITISLDALFELQKEGQFGEERANVLTQRIFQIRDGIITEMGEVRGKWRKRHDP